MKPGIYRGSGEFDRYDNEARRSWLAITAEGRVVVANLPERPRLTRHDIESAPHRLTSVVAWTRDVESLRFEAAHLTKGVTLECRWGGDHVDVVDTAQDAWGGLGGRYERLPDLW
jgi:hypothetical protein